MFKPVLEGIYALIPRNESCNAYLLMGKKATLIDTGLRSNIPLLKESLAGLGITGRQIGLILHTHAHADHFAADAAFPCAEIRMHRHDAGHVNRKDGAFTCSDYFGSGSYPTIKHFLRSGDVLKLKPLSLEVVHTPGHTHGSVCFYEAANRILFSGDTLFSGSVGRYDLPSSSRKELLGSLRTLQNLDFGLLLPGHGPLLAENQKANISSMLSLLENQPE